MDAGGAMRNFARRLTLLFSAGCFGGLVDSAKTGGGYHPDAIALEPPILWAGSGAIPS